MPNDGNSGCNDQVTGMGFLPRPSINRKLEFFEKTRVMSIPQGRFLGGLEILIAISLLGLHPDPVTRIGATESLPSSSIQVSEASSIGSKSTRSIHPLTLIGSIPLLRISQEWGEVERGLGVSNLPLDRQGCRVADIGSAVTMLPILPRGGIGLDLPANCPILPYPSR